ncbi:hypothetical protein, partial [Agrobacterium vitis]|uniref:hypothetical protein n=1 Tax=Agrobacterium vitis TaxID=373 RepID=UPI001AEE83A4
RNACRRCGNHHKKWAIIRASSSRKYIHGTILPTATGKSRCPTYHGDRDTTVSDLEPEPRSASGAIASMNQIDLTTSLAP